MENIKRKQRKLTLEQQKKLSTIAVEVAENAKKMALSFTLPKLKLPEITPSIKETLASIDSVTKNIRSIPQVSTDSFKSEYSGDIFRDSLYQKRMHPEDRKILEEVIIQEKQGVADQNEIPSIYNWKTMDLNIGGNRIRLTPIEKNICTFIFQDPTLKSFTIAAIENAVYEGNNSASAALNQAIKRINKKVREAGFSNIFKIEGKNVLLLH